MELDLSVGGIFILLLIGMAFFVLPKIKIGIEKEIKRIDDEFLEKRRLEMDHDQYLRYLRRTIGSLDALITTKEKKAEDCSLFKEKRDLLQKEVDNFDR